MPKRVIYTAIFGGYNGLIPQKKEEGFDYICFTDDPSLRAKPWQIKVVEPPMANDPTRSNRFYKVLPHKSLDAYEESIYMDDNFWIKNKLGPLIQTYLKERPMAAFDHAQSVGDKRNCIYDEYQAILDLGKKRGVFKDDPAALKKHVDFLREEGYPEHHGLIKGSVLLRKHHDPEVIKVMEDWWHMICNYSKRDQMSFNYVAWKHNFHYASIPGDVRRGNPYVHSLGPHRRNWSKKLWSAKWKNRLGLLD